MKPTSLFFACSLLFSAYSQANDVEHSISNLTCKGFELDVQRFAKEYESKKEQSAVDANNAIEHFDAAHQVAFILVNSYDIAHDKTMKVANRLCSQQSHIAMLRR